MADKSELAAAKFQEGYNCAQSVVYSFSNDINLDKNIGLKLATGFGAGMGRKEEVCGAVTGGILVLCTKFGRDEKGDKSATEKTYLKTRELMDRFAAIHGTYNCRQLLHGCELTSPEGQKTFKDDNLFGTVCMPCVKSVVAIVETLLHD